MSGQSAEVATSFCMMHKMAAKSTSPPKLELALRFSIGDSWLEYTLAKEYASVHSNATDS